MGVWLRALIGVREGPNVRLSFDGFKGKSRCRLLAD